ncbi:MAG: hypothetical protein A2498_16770 [Lentisphaerae bacterium RIFOXYC12_FULL_60_16]|nr:MAG: hypothetical protein A2498_16770 [Lentisphaerae bacterium RIFOXYC12_FULL_60_16]OGV72536.1 MAG: hypothetical protein A2269_05445 [Lentisphaerae bacterium RIFOXYA12_FULL_60_10]OGV86770.1 MAG: hypothetical protein A2340_14025 [Lentisphaerae bacterium RIFOXYB12_FULL_60_10]
MPENHTYRYLKPDDIRRLASYEFAPKALAEGYLAGRHMSRQRGSSIEFHDYRAYTPGDDPALIDWRVFGRTDRYYLRTYEQETNLECHLFLDSSGSMGFGEPATKLEYASFFCAALCYLVIRNTDRVSLTLFDDGVRSFHPPGSTHRHLQQLMHALENNRPGKETRLSEALHRSLPLIRRRGTLIVVSDFLDDPAAIFESLSPYLHRGFKVHLFHVLDPGELELNRHGMQTFVDLETGQRIVAHSDVIRRGYRDAMQASVSRLQSLAARRSVDYALARTDLHYFTLFDHLT